MFTEPCDAVIDRLIPVSPPELEARVKAVILLDKHFMESMIFDLSSDWYERKASVFLIVDVSDDYNDEYFEGYMRRVRDRLQQAGLVVEFDSERQPRDRMTTFLFTISSGLDYTFST